MIVILTLVILAGKEPNGPKKTSGVRTVTEYVLLAAIVLGSYPTYRYWSQHKHEDQRELSEKKKWVIERVQNSPEGSKLSMTSIARSFTHEDQAEVGACDWFASPLWDHSSSNPNWFSQSKGITGMKVISYCNIEGSANQVPGMRFEFEWEDGRGVIGMSWGWEPA